MSEPTPLEYTVYGVLCAAKWETGPGGARRLYRIWERIDASQEDIANALQQLMQRGWARQLNPVLSMFYYEAIFAPYDQGKEVPELRASHEA